MSSPSTLSPEEKIITAIACFIAIAFLLLAPRACKPGISPISLGSGENGQHDLEGSTSSDYEEADLANADLKGETELAETRVAPEEAEPVKYTASQTGNTGMTKGASEQSTASLLTSDNDGTEADMAQLSATVQEHEAALALKADEGTALKAENEELLAKIGSLTSESSSLKEEVQNHGTLLEKKTSELTSSFENSRKGYEKQILSLKKQNETLAQELEDATKLEAPAPAEPEEMEPAETSAVETPPAEENKLAVAQSEEDLGEKRQNLVKEIREMDSLSGDGLASRYKEIEGELGAISKNRIHFASGKTTPRTNEITLIDQIANSSNGESEFLVVGFADQSGTVEGNRSISSKRALYVAERLGAKVGNARVQAIYLGQTARFGSRYENRVVEIWEIMPATSPSE